MRIVATQPYAVVIHLLLQRGRRLVPDRRLNIELMSRAGSERRVLSKINRRVARTGELWPAAEVVIHQAPRVVHKEIQVELLPRRALDKHLNALESRRPL